MGAVAVAVARGGVLVVGCAAGVEPAGADQLVVAGDVARGVLVLALFALAVPLGVDDVLVRPGLGQGGQRRVLGPDAGVQDTDDDALTGVLGVVEVAVPRAPAALQPQEVRGGRGGELVDLVGHDRQDAVAGGQLLGLVGRQLGGEAVQDRVVLGYRVEAVLVQDLLTLVGQEVAVLLDFGGIEVDRLAFVGSGRLHAGPVAVVGGERVGRELDDVVAVGVLDRLGRGFLEVFGDTSGRPGGSAAAGPAAVTSPATTMGTVAAARVILAPVPTRAFARLNVRGWEIPFDELLSRGRRCGG
ncbi:hypothetical protein GCM10029992_09110 [Glycomyces albus]